MTNLKLSVPNNDLMVGLVGERDGLLRQVEAAFPEAMISVRGNEVTVLSGTNPENMEKNYEILYFGNKQISSSISKVRLNSQDSSNNILKKTTYSVLKKILNL